MRSRFIGSEIYRRSTYGGRHPLSIPRVSTCIDLCRALGWLPPEGQPGDAYIDSPRATPAELARFHDPAYIAAVQRAEAEQDLPVEDRERFCLGRNGNPIFRSEERRVGKECVSTFKSRRATYH